MKKVIRAFSALLLSGALAFSLTPATTFATSTADITQSTASSQTTTKSWKACGTCEWQITDDYELIIRPANGASSGTLTRTITEDKYDGAEYSWPWEDENDIKTITIKKGVNAGDSAAGMFMDLWRLEAVNGLENLDTSSVTSMYRMFQDCDSLQKINLSGFNTSKVTDMSKMFSGCTSLQEADLSSLETSSVTTMEDMFYWCSDLNTLKLGSKFAFTSDAYLPMPRKDGTLGKWKNNSGNTYNNSTDIPANVADIYTSIFSDDYWWQCGTCDWRINDYTFTLRPSNGTSGVLAPYVEITDEEEDLKGDPEWPWRDYAREAITVSIEGTISVGESAYEMFDNFGYTETFKGAENLDTSQTTNMRGMFSGLYCVDSINVSKLDTSKVTDFFYMFGACSSLASLDLSNFDTSKAQNVNFMFDSCYSLRMVKTGPKFSFKASYYYPELEETETTTGYLPVPKKNLYENDEQSGLWKNSKTGKVYTSTAKIPNKTAATYVAVFNTIAVNTKTVSAASLKATAKKAGIPAKNIANIALGSKVKTVKPEALKSFTKAKTLVIETKKLTKKSVKNALKGSAIKTVKVDIGSKATNKKYVKKYKKIFTKKVAGKKATVK